MLLVLINLIQFIHENRSSRQTVSWDTPTSLTTGAQRALSIDTNSTNSNETNRCSNISDESGPITTAAPISSSSSEHDNHEAGAWSSDYSNSEDEYPNGEDTAPVRKNILRPNKSKNCSKIERDPIDWDGNEDFGKLLFFFVFGIFKIGWPTICIISVLEN